MSKKDTSLEDIAEAIQGLATQMDAGFERVDRRFEAVDQRFESIESELREIRQEQREMREWLQRIDNHVLGIESDIKDIYDRIVVLEQKAPQLSAREQRELATKLEAMISWAQEVSQKTGIPLPKF